MYSIEKTNYGIKLVFKGKIKKDELLKWEEESKKILNTLPEGTFGTLIDMRETKPLPDESEQEIINGEKLYKEKGMERSAVILNSSITTSQLKKIAREKGIYDWERYIDAAETKNWEEAALDWITKGIDPDE